MKLSRLPAAAAACGVKLGRLFAACGVKASRLPAAAVVAAVCGLLEVLLRPSPDPLLDPVLALCATLPLGVARRRPVPAAAAVTGAVLLTLLDGARPPVAALLVLPAVLFAVGLRASARTALAFAAVLVAYAAGPAATGGAGVLGPVTAGGVTLLGPVTVGAALPGARTLGLLLLMAGAVALAAGAARRSRAEVAARTAAAGAHAGTLHAYAERGERARIARELHDIVAHHISSISVQAETARLTVPGMPPDGAARLRAIGDTARQSLTEMRRLLGVLREDTPAAVPPPPQPGLDRLIALIDDAARATAGSGVRLIVSGPVRRLEPGLELTAYRIVQEALTNARRHAPGAPVDVELRYTVDSLRVTVRDTGSSGPSRPPGDAPGARSWMPRVLLRVAGAASAVTGTPAVEPGHGLLGMRERVAMAGGVLNAGPRPAGGFAVTVSLPIAPAGDLLHAAGGVIVSPGVPRPVAEPPPPALDAGIGRTPGAGAAGGDETCGGGLGARVSAGWRR